MSKKASKIIIISLSVLIALLVFLVLFFYLLNAPISSSDETPEVDEELYDVESDIVEVQRIRIYLDSEVMPVGTRFRPEVIIQPENATDKSFELHSDNEIVLRPQGHNWVAASVGTANLVATAPNGVIGSVSITVIAPDLESISFLEDELVMTVGGITTLNPLLTPNNARLDEPILYTSDNEEVATVTNYGRVNAVGAGNATIKASSGRISAEIKVIVAVPVISINIIMDRHVFSVGEQAEFKIEVEPPDATNASVSVTFSGAPVTSTGPYSFICDAAGEVIITFTAESGSSLSQTITVIDLTVFANEVIRLTNIERATAGLSQLERTQPLTQIALIRAREIMDLFSHTRPDGRDALTVFEDNGIEYSSAGENLAAGQTSPAEAVQSWMNSRGHRENILSGNYGSIGVGVTIDNNGRIYWTQMFMN